jgi:hypothetical protein
MDYRRAQGQERRAPPGNNGPGPANPTRPLTLSRAARDHCLHPPRIRRPVWPGSHPLAVGRLRFGFEITSVDVWEAYRPTMVVGTNLGRLKPPRRPSGGS